MKLKAPSPTAESRAFTLIELLVVIAIIAILAALILGISGFVQEKAGISRAESEIQALSVSLEAYKQDNGIYPEGDGGNNSTEEVLNALYPTNGSKVYMEISNKMLDANKSGDSAETIRTSSKYLVDPFGNNYHYYFNAAKAQDGKAFDNPITKSQNNGPQFFDLWSYGKKGDQNSAPATWIKNW